MKVLFELCNRLLDDPDLRPEEKKIVRNFAFQLILATTRKCGSNYENLEYILNTLK